MSKYTHTHIHFYVFVFFLAGRKALVSNSARKGVAKDVQEGKVRRHNWQRIQVIVANVKVVKLRWQAVRQRIKLVAVQVEPV